MTKFIFITGGVVSSLGKDIAAASLAALLEARGLKITLLKLDPGVGKVIYGAGRKIEGRNADPCLGKAQGHLPPDEPGGASDEHAGRQCDERHGQ